MPRGGHISRVLSVLPKKLSQNPDILKKGFVFILFSVLIFLIQLCTPGFVGIDAYYHVKVSELMMQHGILKDFPWTQVSIWKDKFADKEFLFHVYLMPFLHVFPDLMIAGKFAISVLGGVLFCLFYRLLNQFQIRHALIWTLIAFGTNYIFLQRVCMLRPHVLSLVLTLLFLESLWRHQPWKLFLISLIYPLAYTAAHFLIFIAIIYLTILWIHQRELRVSLLLLTLGGTLAGLRLHPHFPNNLQVWYVQNALLPLFNSGHSQEFWFVAEHTALSKPEFLGACGVTLLLFGSAMVTLILGRRNVSREALLIFTLACGFFGMTLLSMRFAEYWAPFTVLSCALNLNAMKIKHGASAMLKNSTRIVHFGMIFFSVVVYILAALLIPVHFTPELAPVADWLAKNTPQESIVFTTDWSDFPQLFYYSTQNYYLFGLDPVYCYAYDADIWATWVAIVSGQADDPGGEIQNIFRADYVLCPKRPEDTPNLLTAQLLEDHRYRIGYEDEHHLIFAVK